MRTDIETPETHIATYAPPAAWLLLIPALTVLGIAGGTYTAAQAQTAEMTDAGPAGGFGARRLERLLDRVECHRRPARPNRGRSGPASARS